MARWQVMKNKTATDVIYNDGQNAMPGTAGFTPMDATDTVLLAATLSTKGLSIDVLATYAYNYIGPYS